MQILTLVIAIATLIVALFVLWLELRTSREKRRAAEVWRILDECMRIGYNWKTNPTTDYVWNWIERVATFCRKALGYHAQELVLQDVRTREQIDQCEDKGRIITLAQTRIHEHIADKVVEGRLHPDFNETKWKRWTLESPPPETVSFDSPD